MSCIYACIYINISRDFYILSTKSRRTNALSPSLSSGANRTVGEEKKSRRTNALSPSLSSGANRTVGEEKNCAFQFIGREQEETRQANQEAGVRERNK
jgi:hypothetical protein